MVLLLDGNQLMHNAAWFLSKNEDTDIEILPETILSMVKSWMTKHVFTEVYFISDSKNGWRRKFYSQYKTTRKRTSDIDYARVEELYPRAKRLLKTNPRVTVLEHEGLEGDDIIAKLVRLKNAQGKSCAIVSTDSDLKQLLEWNIMQRYINVQLAETRASRQAWLPNNYSFFFKSLSDRKSKMSIFEEEDDFDILYNNMDAIINGSYNINEVDVEKLLFIKIISGDSGDNIKSVWTGIHTRGIGEKGAEKIWEMYREDSEDTPNYLSTQFHQDLAEYCCIYKQMEPTDELLAQLIKNIRHNIRLIHLHNRHIPKELNESFNKEYDGII